MPTGPALTRDDILAMIETHHPRVAAALIARRITEPHIPPHVPHGTLSTYTNWQCRCDPCRAANTSYKHTHRTRLPVRDNPTHRVTESLTP